MQTVLSGTGSSNYIGRAQKILVLQQKVNELQAKQNDSKIKEQHNSNGIIIVCMAPDVLYLWTFLIIVIFYT